MFSKDSLRKEIAKGIAYWTDDKQKIFKISIDFEGFKYSDFPVYNGFDYHLFAIRFGWKFQQNILDSNELTGYKTNEMWRNKVSVDQFIDDVTELGYKHFEQCIQDIKSKLEPPWKFLNWTYWKDDNKLVYFDPKISTETLKAILPLLDGDVKSIEYYYCDDVFIVLHRDNKRPIKFLSISKKRYLTLDEVKEEIYKRYF